MPPPPVEELNILCSIAGRDILSASLKSPCISKILEETRAVICINELINLQYGLFDPLIHKSVQAMSLLPLLEKIKHDTNLLKHSSRLYACGLLDGNPR